MTDFTSKYAFAFEDSDEDEDLNVELKNGLKTKSKEDE